MMIERLGAVGPLNDVLNTQRTSATKGPKGPVDTISVSPEALARAEAYQLAQIAAETPDVRTALIEEVKARIQDPGYINTAIIESVADRFLEQYGI